LARERLKDDPKRWCEEIRQLAADDRFAAVVALVIQLQDDWDATASSQALAACHGKLAHAAGSKHAMNVLRGRLQILLSGERQDPAVGG
jgi:hypothetical protein